MHEGEPPKLSKKEQEEAEKWGGIDLENYEEHDKPYCDKKDHNERSKHNDTGQHLKHKEEE